MSSEDGFFRKIPGPRGRKPGTVVVQCLHPGPGGSVSTCVSPPCFHTDLSPLGGVGDGAPQPLPSAQLRRRGSCRKEARKDGGKVTTAPGQALCWASRSPARSPRPATVSSTRTSTEEGGGGMGGRSFVLLADGWGLTPSRAQEPRVWSLSLCVIALCLTHMAPGLHSSLLLPQQCPSPPTTLPVPNAGG